VYHIEIYKKIAWIDDGSFLDYTAVFPGSTPADYHLWGSYPDGLVGDLGEEAVTESATSAGVGYRKSLASKNIQTSFYPKLRARLKGGGTNPQYRILVEYTPESGGGSTDSGWAAAQTSFFTVTLNLTAARIIDKISIYVKSTANSSAVLSWDYVLVCDADPIVPLNVEDIDVYLEPTVAAGKWQIKLSNKDNQYGSVAVGDWVFIYTAGKGEALEQKLIKGKVANRNFEGDPDNPLLILSGEDQSAVLKDRCFSKSYNADVQPTTVLADALAAKVPELTFYNPDATDNLMRPDINDERISDLIRKFAGGCKNTAGQRGFEAYVDLGDRLHFEQIGKHSYSLPLGPADVSEYSFQDSLDDVVNDVKVFFFDEEHDPGDKDNWTENATDWYDFLSGAWGTNSTYARVGVNCVSYVKDSPAVSQFKVRRKGLGEIYFTKNPVGVKSNRVYNTRISFWLKNKCLKANANFGVTNYVGQYSNYYGFRKDLTLPRGYFASLRFYLYGVSGSAWTVEVQDANGNTLKKITNLTLSTGWNDIPIGIFLGTSGTYRVMYYSAVDNANQGAGSYDVGADYCQSQPGVWSATGFGNASIYCVVAEDILYSIKIALSDTVKEGAYDPEWGNRIEKTILWTDDTYKVEEYYTDYGIFKRFDIPLSDFTTVGYPSNIVKQIEFEFTSTSGNFDTIEVFFDGLHFYHPPCFGHAVDSDSVNMYGRRVGKYYDYTIVETISGEGQDSDGNYYLYGSLARDVARGLLASLKNPLKKLTVTIPNGKAAYRCPVKYTVTTPANYGNLSSAVMYAVNVRHHLSVEQIYEVKLTLAAAVTGTGDIDWKVPPPAKEIIVTHPPDPMQVRYVSVMGS
jgi:hypothetical protein